MNFDQSPTTYLRHAKPTSITSNLRAFFGLRNVYGHIIQGFTGIAHLLNRSIRKGVQVTFEHDDEQRTLFKIFIKNNFHHLFLLFHSLPYIICLIKMPPDMSVAMKRSKITNMEHTSQ